MFTSSLNERCKGIRVRSTVRCGYRWPSLDALGYCKHHTPLALQCRGTSSTTGKRCLANCDLDANQLCEHHTKQTVQCHGLVVSGSNTVKRCRATRSVNRHGFCPNHPLRNEDILRDFARTALRVDSKEALESKVKALEDAMAGESHYEEGGGSKEEVGEEEEGHVKEEDVKEEHLQEINVKLEEEDGGLKQEVLAEEEDEGPMKKKIKTER